MTDLNRATLLDQLLYYVTNELEIGALAEKITTDSPVLEWGVLDSVRTARLLAHIGSEDGLRVPSRDMTDEHFRTVGTITDLVLSLRTQTAAAPLENR
ncbi:phosphopantetheine-binding protein [Frankia sp. Cr1]|uniref:phosphopantetheine-binding protein n=1 Tax=Frankia sp. Cr1 TaxID=3073931 RepID=UPI002AD371D6|nr:phosphopantetheine-binding protein [Frankia sp. Cr1]